jgi:hypothetical protein
MPGGGVDNFWQNRPAAASRPLRHTAARLYNMRRRNVMRRRGSTSCGGAAVTAYGGADLHHAASQLDIIISDYWAG